MADITNEMETVANYVEANVPGAKISLQNVPIEPQAGDLDISLLDTVATSESGYHYRLDRSFQLVYFGASAFAVIEMAEQLERLFNDVISLPLANSDRYLSLRGYSATRPFKTESGAHAIIGVIEATVRDARTQPVFPKIQQVNARYE